MPFQNSLLKLKNKQNLTVKETEQVFEEIFIQDLSESLIKEFLTALYEKGESFEEILGAVRFLRSKSEKVNCLSQDLIDCCGTGGDQKNTFNISTAVAFVLAGAGCHVAKHGAKAVTSQSGSADILTELGVNIQAPKEVMAKSIDEVGIGFLFAPNYHPLLKKVAGIRKSLPHRTIFNILGPLLNPADAKKQLIGVYEKRLVPIMAQILKELGSESVVITHSQDGLDEISLTGLNEISQLSQGRITNFTFDPKISGYSYCSLKDLEGGSVQENAKRMRLVLKGHSQPLDHTVHINAAWGLIAAGKVVDFMEGLLMVQEAISSGKAYKKLEELIEFTNSAGLC